MGQSTVRFRSINLSATSARDRERVPKDGRGEERRALIESEQRYQGRERQYNKLAGQSQPVV